MPYVPERKTTLIYDNPQKWNICWGNIFLLFHTFDSQSMSDSIYIYHHCHSLHLHNQCPHLPSHLHLKCPSSLTYYNISSVPSTALDIRHFLKPFTFASVRYAAVPFWSALTTYYILYFLVFKCNLIPCRFTLFSTDGFNNLNRCVLCICVISVVWSVCVLGPF